MGVVEINWFGWQISASILLLGFAFVLALLILGTIAALVLPAIQPGKWADLIAVTGDPLQNIRLLEDVKFVMKGGIAFKQ